MENSYDVSKVRTRIGWVDYVKVFGIFCVLLGHNNLANEHITQYIFSFHIPLFFLLSGYLYKQTDFKSAFLKTVKTLIIPYILINFVCLAYVSLFSIRDGLFGWDFLISRLGAIALGLGYPAYNLYPVCYPLWFLIALFIDRFILSLCKTEVHHIVTFFISITICICFRFCKIDTLIPIDSALLAYPFLILGLYIKNLFNTLFNVRYFIRFIISILLIFLTILINRINGPVDINNMIWGNDMLLFYMCGLFFFVAIVMIFGPLKWGRVICVFSSGTILMMGFGNILTEIVLWLYNHFIVCHIDFSYFTGPLVVLIVMLICVLLTVFCRKYFPAILGYR
ncbi:acyltransferase family protein [uncultured Prevotella sp.]|uniref:acyltransferase family protein n=1 Tax=uncultured Prevotella sp. TaxID=159272 RepID=UPI00338E9E60